MVLRRKVVDRKSGLGQLAERFIVTAQYRDRKEMQSDKEIYRFQVSRNKGRTPHELPVGEFGLGKAMQTA